LTDDINFRNLIGGLAAWLVKRVLVPSKGGFERCRNLIMRRRNAATAGILMAVARRRILFSRQL
jgi:hypothetical protein